MGGWPSRTLALAALALTGGGVLGACGSSSKTTASTASSSAAAATSTPSTPGSPPSTPAIPPNAPPALRAVAGRVLNAGDLTGFAPQGRRTLGMNASMWVAEEHLPPAQQTSETARLQHLGFATAVSERLAPASGPAEAISVVVLFHSAQAARSNLAAEVRRGTARGASAFAVPGIPGAEGFGGATAGSTGYNVAFAIGNYYYLVGAGYPTGAPHPPTHEELIVAAQRLYARLHR
jgi:hypothetical protein